MKGGPADPSPSNDYQILHWPVPSLEWIVLQIMLVDILLHMSTK